MTDLRDFLDPASGAEIERLQVVAREVVEGFLRGLHLSPAKGSSIEFAEHRAYVPGDEIRRIDWRNYARTDRYFVKEFEDETNLRALFVLDHSASMGFGSGPLTKLRYGACLAAALGHLLLGQRDAVGLALVGQTVDAYLPPKATAEHLSGVYAALEGAIAEGGTAIGAALHQVAQRLRGRSLVVVISDLLDEPDRVLEGIAQLRHRGSDVVVFHVMDPEEIELPFTSWLVFQDPENPEIELRLDARQVRGVYLDLLNAHREALRRGTFACAADYVFLSTREPFASALAKFLVLRRRLESRSQRR